MMLLVNLSKIFHKAECRLNLTLDTRYLSDGILTRLLLTGFSQVGIPPSSRNFL